MKLSLCKKKERMKGTIERKKVREEEIQRERERGREREREGERKRSAQYNL